MSYGGEAEAARLRRIVEMSEQGEQVFGLRYTQGDGVASESNTDTIRTRRLGATPLGRRVPSSGVDDDTA